MNTKSSPSRYRYCISRLSTFATSTRTPALNVLSTTFPDNTFFSFVRTKAPPLPGLTCWKSTTLQSAPSMLSVMPFLRSFVVATGSLLHANGTAVPESQDEQFLGGRGEYLWWSRLVRAASTDDEGVLDPDSALAGQIDPRLDGDGNPICKSTCPAARHQRRFVHLKANPVAQAMTEMAAMPGSIDDATGGGVHVADLGIRNRSSNASQLGFGYQLIDFQLPGRRLPERNCPRHVRVIAAIPGAAIDRDEIAGLECAVARRMMRDRAVRTTCDDGVERRCLGSEIDHRAFQQHCQVALGPARHDLAEDLAERVACYR